LGLMVKPEPRVLGVTAKPKSRTLDLTTIPDSKALSLALAGSWVTRVDSGQPEKI